MTMADADWRGRDRFTLLTTHSAEPWLTRWRADADRCTHLDLIVVTDDAVAARSSRPTMKHGLHRVSLDQGRVQLLLARGTLRAWLPELVATVDAFDLDAFLGNDFSSNDFSGNDLPGHVRIAKALGRLAAPDASLHVRGDRAELRAELTTAGFTLLPASNDGITHGRYAPRFTPKRPPAWHAPSRRQVPRRAVVIGAGLAGCAAAWALAEHGWHSRVIERQPHIASEASGNPAGLFHGTVNAPDGVHARFNRAAAQMAGEAVQTTIDTHGVAGSTAGLLRLEFALDFGAMSAMLAGLGLPAADVQAIDAERASALAGIALTHPAWLYPGGGWVAPAGLAASFLARAGAWASVDCGIAVASLGKVAGVWQLHDADGTLIDESEVVVLANAGDALRLCGPHGLSKDAVWPMGRVRGQLSVLGDARSCRGLSLPRLPIAGAGYLLPEVGGSAVFGATAQSGDNDPSVRDSDHAANLVQLQRLIGHALPIAPAELQGRTAWRWSMPDRLPMIGPVPDSAAWPHGSRRLDHPRFVPRMAGLHVFTALGSRGITWSALGAQVLAAGISGAPQPLAADLLAAIDPARFISRAARRSAG